jgi:hypothetical protein
VKLSAVQKNDIVKRVRACRYPTQAEALHAAVQLAEESIAEAQPAGEPFAWARPAIFAECSVVLTTHKEEAEEWVAHGLQVTPLYTAPPAAARVPLTREQMIDAIAPLCADREIASAMVHCSADEYRAIERAHGITGGAA